MSDDLITRLRGIAYECDEQRGPDRWVTAVEEAADEIERLRSALVEIAEAVGDPSAYYITRAALEAAERQLAEAEAYIRKADNKRLAAGAMNLIAPDD